MGEAKRRSTAGIRLRRLYPPARLGPIAKLVIPSGAGQPSREQAAETAALAETVRVRVRGALLRASSAGSVERMQDAIDSVGGECVAAFEDALARAAAADATRRRELASIACRRGCAFCCHVEVVVTPLEAIRLARRAAPPDSAAAAAPPEIAAPAAQRRAPCPLLADGACTQYEARPYACRGVFSPDAKACEAGYASEASVAVPSLDWPRHLAAGYITGEIAALEDLKFASHMVELRCALAVLSGDGDAMRRWLNGADVFPRRTA